MVFAQITAALAIGMPFPTGGHGGPLVVAREPIKVEGLGMLVSAEAGQRVWLVNDKGYLTRSWGENVKPAEIASWRSGVSLPTGFVATDPRTTIVPLPKLGVSHSWMDLFAAGIRIGQSKKLNGAGQVGLLVLFMSTEGPADDIYAERISLAATAAEQAKIGVIALFPGKTETKASLARFIVKHGFTFPCGVDCGNAYADAYRATRTPEAFLLDAKLRVVYTGAIDSNTFGSDGTTPYLMNALHSLASGAKPSLPSTRAFGTPIDR